MATILRTTGRDSGNKLGTEDRKQDGPLCCKMLKNRLGTLIRVVKERGGDVKSVNARFAIKSWDEKSYSEGPDLPKLTRASVAKTFTGDIDGKGTSALGHANDYPFTLNYELD